MDRYSAVTEKRFDCRSVERLPSPEAMVVCLDTGT